MLVFVGLSAPSPSPPPPDPEPCWVLLRPLKALGARKCLQPRFIPLKILALPLGFLFGTGLAKSLEGWGVEKSSESAGLLGVLNGSAEALFPKARWSWCLHIRWSSWSADLQEASGVHLRLP